MTNFIDLRTALQVFATATAGEPHTKPQLDLVRAAAALHSQVEVLLEGVAAELRAEQRAEHYERCLAAFSDWMSDDEVAAAVGAPCLDEVALRTVGWGCALRNRERVWKRYK